MKRGKVMKKLVILVFLFSLLGVMGVVDNLHDSGLEMDSRVLIKNDPGDGGMGSWK